MVKKIIDTLLAGGIVILRTDTIYGIVAAAVQKNAVERLYQVKQRDSDKQCIVLIADANSVPAHNELIEFYTEASERPTSIIVPVSDEPEWITRGGKDVAYRMIQNGVLKQIIDAVGPLVAPSANPDSLPPARTIEQAREYFGDNVNLYVDGGEVAATTPPSHLIRINPDGSVDVLR